MAETYDLSAFMRDLDAIIDQEKDNYRSIVNKGKPLLGRLIADMRWLAPRYYEPREGASVQYLLNKASVNKYTITSVVFWQGYQTPVHNHDTWGVIGIWQGEEQEERFKRTDDGTRSDYAQLRPAGTVTNTPGSLCHLIPPDEEIHRIRTVSSKPSYSIHVYGGDIFANSRQLYNLETGAITQFQVKAVVLD
jgi:predicted metal-dependent enzyme (double-stranded beta helix superfamily)